MAAPRGRFKMQLDGFDAVVKAFDTAIKVAEEGMHEAMDDIAHSIYKRSQTLCPVSHSDDVDTRGKKIYPTEYHGYLKETSGVEVLGPLNFRIWYGAWYAVYVHEVFRSHTPPTQWRFLAQAVDEAVPHLRELLATKFQASFGAVDVGGGYLSRFQEND